MNNLHRELAPISEAAWAQIEEETSRTIKRYLAGRRVVDVHGPAGALSRPWEQATSARLTRPETASPPNSAKRSPSSSCAFLSSSTAR